MNLYLLVPLFAVLVSTVLAVVIGSQDPRDPLCRRAALLFVGIAFWATCELLAAAATDPQQALVLARLTSLGWAPLGPLSLDVLLRLAGQRGARARRALPWLYGSAAAVAAVSASTGLVQATAVRTAFGWGFTPGALQPVAFAFVAGCLVAGMVSALRAERRSPSPAERTMIRWIGGGAAIPLCVAGVTDVLLPMLGVHGMRLAPPAFSLLGVVVLLGVERHGHALVTPSSFAREILDTIPDGIALLGLDGHVRHANRELARLLGRPADSLGGLPLLEQIRGLGASEGGECALTTGGGELVPVSVASRPLADKLGRPFGRMVVLRDCSEIADLRRRLVTAGRLAAVGELAAGIAHEINNPIAFVGSNLASLREYWAEVSKDAEREARSGDLLRDGEELIDDCLEGIARVKQIVQDVKGFAHAGEERAFVSLNALLDAALRVARPLLPPGARLEQFLSDVPHVRASARHLQQVFLNLLTNAAQAIGPSGTIRVQTTRTADGVLVRVSDDGCGMSPEVLERVFDPFFTTKAVGEGTGLGLAISYQIVRSHGGEIHIESAPGAGTRVFVQLPLDAAAEGDPAQTEAPAVR